MTIVHATTFRERMLRAMNGDGTGRPVFAPRMDLWYIAQRARGTLPDEFAGMTMADLADALGMACHAVRADYTLVRDPDTLVGEPDGLALRGLGFDNHPDYPFRVDVEGLDLRFEKKGETFTTTIVTSRGPVDWTLRYTEDMARSGVSLPFVLEYPVKKQEDLARVAEVFEHFVITPTPSGYRAFQERVGDRGVAVANGCIAASPMHLLLHDLMPMDRFFYAYHDDPRALHAFCDRVTPVFDRILSAAGSSGAETVLWGGNYDRNLTWPPFFDDQIVPWLRRAGASLRSRSTLLLTHCDGENDGLIPGYRAAEFDVAESVCPIPMTRMSVATLRRELGPWTCIWGGVPSVALLRESYDDRQFARWLDGMLAEIGPGDGMSPLILGVSDNVPPDADLSRLRAIAKAVS